MRLFGWLKRESRDGWHSRTEQWRQDWMAAAAQPTAEQIEALASALRELGLSDDEVEIEREMLDALERVAALASAVADRGLPAIDTHHRIAGRDTCHFSAPASIPDDPAQPAGRLLLTSARAAFAGGLASRTIPWHAIVDVQHQDRDLLLIRSGRETAHRFRCNSYGDALCARFIARRLIASPVSFAPSPVHPHIIGRMPPLTDGSPAHTADNRPPGTRVVPGIDLLLGRDRSLIAGRRVGLVCNPASVDARFQHSADRLLDRSGATLAAIFGPQHGFRSDLQDNMIETPHARDARRRVPVFSLYSETREPTADMLRDLDVLVVDLQDVGTRVYTYIYTMANCMRAAAKHRVKVVVCDRPNPLGGEGVEGPLLREQWTSFVGQFPIPLRHGMTIGELARLFNGAFGLGAELEVIPLEGWRRAMYNDDTGLPWIIPSPNLPTLDSAIVYPGAVLFEGTMLSEGRGTTRPFELIGAPWIDGESLAAAMNARALPGVHFRPVFFEPTFQKHARQTCGGCQIHVLDRAAFRPVRTAVELIAEFRRQDPQRFAWRQPPYEYEHEKMPIDLLYGSDRLRAAIDAGEDVQTVIGAWAGDEREFRRLREPYLLYR